MGTGMCLRNYTTRGKICNDARGISASGFGCVELELWCCILGLRVSFFYLITEGK